MERKSTTKQELHGVEESFRRFRQTSPEANRLMDIIDQEESIISEITRTRVKRGISQRELEKLSGIKQPMIDRIERGECSPRIDTLIKLLLALDLELTVKPRKQAKKSSPVQIVEPNKEAVSK